MPWNEVSAVDLREEFVMLALSEGSNMRALCQRFSISPTTGYKWLARHAAEGRAGLHDRSRRPGHSPGRTPAALEARVLALRDEHPAWGGRKLRRRLLDLGTTDAPGASTITGILRRNGRLDKAGSAAHRRFIRFEHAAPNDLWQMDFKGHFALGRSRCHPLTVLDDHSRFAVCLEACADERAATVRQRLTATFRRHGLPWRILADNGAPWGDDAGSRHTVLTVWLLRLGVAISHGRPYHPQTQGKAERFHRSLAAELLARQPFADLAECQRRFDAWRHVYNTERPHEALDLDVPISRYAPSSRPFPESPPPIEYDHGDIVRRVDAAGRIGYRARRHRIGKAFRGCQVALKPAIRDGRFNVFFADHLVATIDLNDAP
ncbi:MAG: IS481 family transposase [Alphaproteobacteria bacterium]